MREKTKIHKFMLAVFLCTVQMQTVPAAGVQEGDVCCDVDSLQDNKTASGEPCDRNVFTPAHRSLPFGTSVKVTCPAAGQSFAVVINDSGLRAQARNTGLSGTAAVKAGYHQALAVLARVS